MSGQVPGTKDKGNVNMTMEWKPVCDRPELDVQPCRQFIRLEGSRDHSGLSWGRVWCGEAFTRRPGTDGEMLQYRESDILRLCADGDMDPWSAVVTHWMPAAFPPLMDIPSTAEVMGAFDQAIDAIKSA